MGRTTFEPALNNDRWPWPDLDLFVLASHRPGGTPEHVVSDDDPVRLLERIRAANRAGDVHLVGGPTTIETYRRLGALDRLEIVVLPVMFGAGMRLTPAIGADARLELQSARSLAGGSVEIVYTLEGSRRRAVGEADQSAVASFGRRTNCRWRSRPLRVYLWGSS
jgi:dihydrofolate reductase